MKVLVTGGGGFLGLAITRRLVARGDAVRSFSRHRHAELDELGVEQAPGDLGDRDAVLKAAEGCGLIFHVAALPGIWGPRKAFHRTNVLGTQHVLDACETHAIRRLVHTSSPSVIFSGGDMEGVDESVPYPATYLADYPATKAEAERRVLGANGPELATVALRPHLIWGPGDNHLAPRILERGRRGQLRRLGKRNPLVDVTYVDDAADAHLLAADKLEPGSAIGGRVYFISGGQPVPLWDMVNGILKAGGLPPVTKSIPVGIAYAAGAVLETAFRLCRLKAEPRMTRFLANELSTAHWFDIGAARRDLGFAPKVTVEEGLKRLARWLETSGIPSR